MRKPEDESRFDFGKIQNNPMFRRIIDSDSDGVEDTHPRNPMDTIGGFVSPTRGNVGGLTNSEAMILEEQRKVIVNMGKEHGRQFLKRSFDQQFTSHGNLRVNQRLPSEKDIESAVVTAIKSGKITRKAGQYGTYQYHYEGDNGLKVIIDTEGRNAGKVITTYWQGTKGDR